MIETHKIKPIETEGDLICPDCLREISGFDESEEIDDSTDSD